MGRGANLKPNNQHPLAYSTRLQKVRSHAESSSLPSACLYLSITMFTRKMLFFTGLVVGRDVLDGTSQNRRTTASPIISSSLSPRNRVH